MYTCPIKGDFVKYDQPDNFCLNYLNNKELFLAQEECKIKLKPPPTHTHTHRYLLPTYKRVEDVQVQSLFSKKKRLN